jgi:hypothetical protein
VVASGSCKLPSVETNVKIIYLTSIQEPVSTEHQTDDFGAYRLPQEECTLSLPTDEQFGHPPPTYECGIRTLGSRRSWLERLFPGQQSGLHITGMDFNKRYDRQSQHWRLTNVLEETDPQSHDDQRENHRREHEMMRIANLPPAEKRAAENNEIRRQRHYDDAVSGTLAQRLALS